MSYTLGIHVGHDASCAVVYQGQLVAAVQQERISRRKHDAVEGLTNRLPIYACLKAAGIRISDVDHIVSSFQTVAPGGFGLHRPLIYPDFDIFDPLDRRHIVISHHLAHAYCTFYSSGFNEAAVLICDLGGSSTLDGADFQQPFADWYAEITRLEEASIVQTENLSLYEASYKGIVLKEREFCVPHSVPESFVQNLASLYDNVSRCIFGREDAHGQLMALAALNNNELRGDNEITASDIIRITSDDCVIFRNNWQQKVRWGSTIKQQANLAHACQRATELALMAHARRLRRLSSSANLVVAGGVFLNIIGNTKIAESGLFERYYVPSAPNDAGISIGCAFFGDVQSGTQYDKKQRSPVCDRLGYLYGTDLIGKELANYSDFIHYSSPSSAEIAAMLVQGTIIARWSGRAEFGPRALGGRSLLGSPLLTESKDRLNKIKGRQSWRPVAPIVPQEKFSNFFSGPSSSLYMTFAHQIHPEHVESLPALHHPDGSTRTQTLPKRHDPTLHQLLLDFGSLTGYPILVNTSLNGAKEPILETPQEALRFFLAQEDVDALLLDSWLVLRREPWERKELRERKIRLADGCLISLIFPKGVKRALISLGQMSFELSEPIVEILSSLGKGRLTDEVLSEVSTLPNADNIKSELYHLLVREIIITVTD